MKDDLARWPVAREPSRRRFLAMAAATLGSGILSRPVLGRQAAPDGDEAERAAVQILSRQAGLPEFSSRTSENYLVLGDAPEPFLNTASQICEGLAQDYLKHFRQKGFDVQRPSARLTVVALSGPEAYAAFLGSAESEAVGGHYEPATNRLVIFDNRARADAGPMVQRANTVALMHEAMHQLTFNTGLLTRGTTIPLCLNEGLGTYAESRRPDGRTPIGRPNEGRLRVLIEASAQGNRWIPTAELFADEALFSRAEHVQQAYAESWLLAYQLLQSRARTTQFQKFLGISREPRQAGSPLDVRSQAETAFGDLAALDGELQTAFRRLVRR